MLFHALQELLYPQIVNRFGSSGLRVEQINIECELEKVIEWNEIQNIVKNWIKNSANCINHPKRKPLGIILASSGLNRLEAHVGRIEEPHA